MMQYGLGSYAYAWAIGVPGYDIPQPMTHIAFIERAAELGFGLVQIADNLPLHTLSDEQSTAMLLAAKSQNIRIEVGTRGIAPDHLRRYLEIAQRCKSSILRVVVDTSDHHPEPDEVIDTLGDILPEFAKAKITIAIENHDRFKSATLAHIIQVLDNPYVGICLDTVNSFGALEGPDVVIDMLGPYVVNLHLKDFEIKRLDHNMGFSLTGTPAGSGMLDIPSLIRRLKAFNREFNAILELWPWWTGDALSTIDMEDRWARESVRYLAGVSIE